MTEQEQERYVDPNSGGAPQPGSWAGEEAAALGFGPPPPDLEEEPKPSEYTPPGWDPSQDQPVESVVGVAQPVEVDDQEAQYGELDEDGRKVEASEPDEGDEGDEEPVEGEEPVEEEPEEEDEFTMANTKEELQEACRDRGLDDSGTKQELLDRLYA